ncbi:MAG: type II secretion system F family protein [Candidatus Kaiserbacteria bacterium]|nr:type II secretion system F family protein [Candidatus Kaiserbacteria bacterium]MCB9816595.1 type II secretion system F family protein [Candidatus Nomurabacteria bacterium]
MTQFTYTGEDTSGTKVSNTVEAEDRFAVYAIARSQGHTVASIKEKHGAGFGRFLNIDKINFYLNRVSDDELIMSTRNLGSMLVAGLTVPRALSVIERQSKNPRLKGTMKRLVERINQGDPFHDALREFPKTFSDLYVSMIRAGEESGKLAESLQTLAIQMERANNLKKKIKGAMIYPSIVIIVMVVIGILMMIYVMPQITGVFEGMDKELPATTEFLIATSNFLVEYTVVAIGSMIGIIFGFIYFLRTKWGKIASSWLVVRLPVIGKLAKEANAARTARTLSSLLESGVDMIQSVEITEEVLQNVYYKAVLRDAAKRVEKGTALSETFIERQDLYPVLVGEMILVGEETGQIAGMLGELAIFYETEVERKTKDLSTIIEPLLMVVIGGGVGFFALALIAPIYSISEGIG